MGKTWKPTVARILNIIAAIFGSIPLGIVATVLMALAKGEFE